MRIVITGASGNVGTALLRRLADSGHELVGVSRRRPPQMAPYAGVEWFSLDLGRTGAAVRLAEVLRGADAVVHLAWLIQPGRDREQLRRTNQGGTRAVLTAARSARIGHLVHASSVGTYAAAPDDTWADESWPSTGVATSSYSVDKAACERMLDSQMASDDELAVTRIRPALVLQPDAASEIARYFLGRLVPTGLARPAVFRLAPWPESLRVQFVHADDVAAGIDAILQRRATGAFNLAAEPVIDRAEVRRLFGGVAPPAPIRALRVAADLSWRAHLQPTDPGWIDLAAAVPQMRTDRARAELDWVPQRRADDTLLSFLRALRDHRGGSGPLLNPG